MDYSNKYILLQILQYYNEINEVKNIGIFDSIEQANSKIEEVKKFQDIDRKTLVDYVENYVDNLDIPKDYNERKLYFKQIGASYLLRGNEITDSIDNLNYRLKENLKQKHQYKLNEYHPPKVSKYSNFWLDFHIIPLKPSEEE